MANAVLEALETFRVSTMIEGDAYDDSQLCHAAAPALEALFPAKSDIAPEIFVEWPSILR
jgi:hypothetical protein